MSEIVDRLPADLNRAGSRTPPTAPGMLSRALTEAAEGAHDALEVEDSVAAVHELRKSFKRLRGLLRLVRGRQMQPARELRRALADAARQLSGARDQAAQREAMDDLVAKAGVAPAVCKVAIRALAAPEQADDDDALARHRVELATLIEGCIEAAPHLAGTMGPKALLAALGEDYEKARSTGQEVDVDDAEGLHELRKTVVNHRYQMELFTPFWPAQGKLWETELQRLREKLGKHHDLTVLIERLDDNPPTTVAERKWHTPLHEAAHARQQRLAMSAMRLHARLFAERPKAFRRRLGAYMNPMSDGE